MENPENLNENMYEIDEDIAAAEEAAARINEGKRLARKQLVEMQAGLPHRAALLNNIQFACICEAALLDTTSAQEALRRDLEEARGVIAGLKSQLDFRGPQGVNTADKYQEDCLRTAARAKNLDLELAILGLGLTGEAGEVADHIKKHVGHKHHLDKEKVIKELGDTMWYISILAYHMGYELSDVMRINVQKLLTRYPEGFSPDASIKRADVSAHASNIPESRVPPDLVPDMRQGLGGTSEPPSEHIQGLYDLLERAPVIRSQGASGDEGGRL